MPDINPEADFYFAAPASTTGIETLEISQVSFSQVWYLQFSYRLGMWARLENGEQAFFQCVPMRLRKLEETGNLDFGLTVTLGDLGEILPDEIQRAREAGTLRTHRPRVVYRVYRSDDLEAPMVGPIVLQAREIARTNEGAQFNAKAPELNVSKTGELYTTDRFPMLLGFL